LSPPVFPRISRTATLAIAAAAILPRLVVLLVERGSTLTAYTEKSDNFAQTFIRSGTYGFLPGHPSAYTQPLYGFFLIPIYWIFGRNWPAVGLAQIAVATATAFIVYAIAARVVPRFAVLAALVSTLNPYLVWHDVHVNREIIDQLVLASLVLCALITLERKSVRWMGLCGLLAGVSILGNSRLILIPVLFGAVFAAFRVRGALIALVVVVGAASIVVLPWVVRNKADVGCFAITTDGRALWKANNANTYGTLESGKWIDDVYQPKSFPPTPEDVARIYHRTGRLIHVSECAQMTRFENLAIHYVEHHPAEKAKLMLQATWLLWDPRVHETQGRPHRDSWVDLARSFVEPIWAIPVFVLAAIGIFFAQRQFAVIAGALLAYNTMAAMVFAGTTRYRIPFDFLLAILALVGLQRVLAIAPETLNRKRLRFPGRVKSGAA
jgi:4-amino-4-deoxy-L-arabinose transferase-like glycosyltransferase